MWHNLSNFVGRCGNLTKEVATRTKVEREGCKLEVTNQTQDQQTKCKKKALSVQEQNRVKPSPNTQQTRGVKRKRTPMFPYELELIEIDHVLSIIGVIEQEFQEWKSNPLKEERRDLILELDKLFVNM